MITLKPPANPVLKRAVFMRETITGLLRTTPEEEKRVFLRGMLKGADEIIAKLGGAA